MIQGLDFLREMNIISVVFRLSLAMFFGGCLGLERGTKRRPAGFRTYMLVCIGATLTMLLGQYEYAMLTTTWAETATQVGTKIDVSRFGAQVINGIGFLGAGTIIVTGRRRQIKGLTTAAGLWTAACMGLAIGAGFYECVIVVFALMFLIVKILPKLESRVVEYARNTTLYVEFSRMEDLAKIIGCIKCQEVQILEMEITRTVQEKADNPSAVFQVRLAPKMPHTRVIIALSELDCVYLIEEL